MKDYFTLLTLFFAVALIGSIVGFAVIGLIQAACNGVPGLCS